MIPVPVRRLVAIVAAAAGVLGLALGGASAAQAHPVGTSGLFVTIHETSVEAQFQIGLARLDEAMGVDLTTDRAVLVAAERIERYVGERFSISDDRGALALAYGEPVIEVINGEPAVVIDVLGTPSGGAVSGAVVLDSTVLTQELPEHRVYVALISDWTGGHVVEGEPVILAVLDGTSAEVVVARGDASWWTGFGATLVLGMQHIAEGTDHMLFLIVLMLSAPLIAARARFGWRWSGVRRIPPTIGRTALIVTAFTLGHTVTLALVSLGLLSFPTEPVEVLVAISIAIAAAHAIKPLLPRGEILVAGVFGLVHGTAFATTILELQLSQGATIAAIIGFNVGVELAQLVVVALVLPLVILLSRSSAATIVRIAIAAFAIVASAAWVVGIVTGTDSVLTPMFDAIAANPIPYYGVAAAAVIAVWALARPPRPARVEDGGV